MSLYTTFPTSTFTVDQTNIALTAGDSLLFKFQVSGVMTNDFTASISAGSLSISSLATATGYATTACPYLDSTFISAGSNSNEIIFSAGISSLYTGTGGYIFVPNPTGGTPTNLYDMYGNVDYPFQINFYDIILIYLSDGTYIESRILNVYKDTSNKLRLTLDATLSNFVKSDLASGTYQRILILTRIQDETNAYVVFNKRPGQTSYGFIIPNTISTDVMDNIDTITKEVKQKLLGDQSIIDAISGGDF